MIVLSINTNDVILDINVENTIVPTTMQFFTVDVFLHGRQRDAQTIWPYISIRGQKSPFCGRSYWFGDGMS